MSKKAKLLDPIHPGEILREDFLKPFGISINQLARDLDVPFGLTFSCYDPDADGRACGQCDACLLRRKGFEEAGVEDR